MVVTGAPSVTLEFADANSTGAASYEDTGGATILFSYTVDDGDRATDGIEIKAGSLTAGTGSIQGTDGTDANLTHNKVSLTPIYYEIFIPGGMERHGDGWKLSVRLRLVHARVRLFLAESPDWDHAARGTLVIAAHTGFGIAAFSARLLHHMDRLGAHATPEKRPPS